MLHTFSSLFNLFTSFLVLLLLFGRLLIHRLTKFVDVPQHFALFLPQTLQFPFDLVFFLLRLSCAKFRFQLFQSFVEHLLTTRQLLQSIQNLQLLSLFVVLFLLLLSLTFGFIAIAFVVKFQLTELLLRRTVLLSLTLSWLRL